MKKVNTGKLKKAIENTNKAIEALDAFFELYPELAKDPELRRQHKRLRTASCVLEYNHFALSGCSTNNTR